MNDVHVAFLYFSNVRAFHKFLGHSDRLERIREPIAEMLRSYRQRLFLWSAFGHGPSLLFLSTLLIVNVGWGVAG